MKRIILLLCMLALLCCAAPALANQWGLRGELLTLVSQTHDWDEYISMGDQAENSVILKSRYHHALLIAQEEGLQVYTKALFQPDGSYRGKPLLTSSGSYLSIRYHDGLWFSFALQEDGYALMEARCGELRVNATEDPYRYSAVDGEGVSAELVGRVLLEDFNIELFPRTINEVRHLNLMRHWLDSETFCTTPQEERVQGAGEGAAPVYSAPFGQSAWRAAKGKAAVGLKGGVTKLFPFRNADGEEYWCIRYDVSRRTQRIGYLERRYLDGANTQPWPETEQRLAVNVTVIQETYLTDDPDVSQYPQFTLPVGTILTCMGLYHDDYAYVAAEVKDGRVVDGGAIVWGFVPLRDLQMTHIIGAQPEQKAMAQLTGTWWFAAGGISTGDRLVLRDDGSYDAYLDEPSERIDTGRWCVYAYDPACGAYWNDPSYELVLVSDTGAAAVNGLTLEEDGFSLTNWEGGGGYERVK